MKKRRPSYSGIFVFCKFVQKSWKVYVDEGIPFDLLVFDSQKELIREKKMGLLEIFQDNIC